LPFCLLLSAIPFSHFINAPLPVALRYGLLPGSIRIILLIPLSPVVLRVSSALLISPPGLRFPLPHLFPYLTAIVFSCASFIIRESNSDQWLSYNQQGHDQSWCFHHAPKG
jgi:hypothetical protein